MDHSSENTPGVAAAQPMRLYGYIGLAIIVAAEMLMLKGFMPVARFFTPIAWTGYILFVDALIFKLRGHSLLCSRTREFALMLPLSIGCWAVFEGYNLFLNNWYYENLPEDVLLRYFGYAWSFATVFPGIFLTTELLEETRLVGKCSVRPWRITTRLLLIWAATGLICLVVPLFYHSPYMFPPVWAGFIFLLEPINYSLGRPSLLRDLERGNSRRLWSLLAAGLICGILWEFWNYWTYTKWIYTVPYPPNVKIFEMPLLGWLGFPPFAVECYAMYHTCRAILRVKAGPEAGQFCGCKGRMSRGRPVQLTRETRRIDNG